VIESTGPGCTVAPKQRAGAIVPADTAESGKRREAILYEAASVVVLTLFRDARASYRFRL
jgi:hypothetical protein